jgi:hypothetical protein
MKQIQKSLKDSPDSSVLTRRSPVRSIGAKPFFSPRRLVCLRIARLGLQAIRQRTKTKHGNIMKHKTIVLTAALIFAGATYVSADVVVGDTLNIGGNTVDDYAGNSIAGGGSSSIADAIYTTIAGGGWHTVSGNSDFSFIGGGSANVILSSPSSVIGGGGPNLIAADEGYAVIGGGSLNCVTEYYSTIGGGYYNTNSGYISTIAGGWGNLTTGWATTVPGGYQAHASLYGQMAHASGTFTGVRGEAQASEYTLRRVTTTSSTAELFLDNSSERMALPSNGSWSFDVLVVARGLNGDTAGFKTDGVIKKVSGVTTLLSSSSPISPTYADSGLSGSTIQIAGDNNALTIKVTGNSSTNRWVATVRTTEVKF